MVEDQDILGLDVAVSNFVFLQMSKCIEQKIYNLNDLWLAESFAFGRSAGNEILKVHFSTLHDDMGIFGLAVLINFEHRYEISVIFNHVLAELAYFLHVGDFVQEALILIVTFYFDLLQRIQVIMNNCSVNVGIASAYFVHYPDVL